MKIEGSVILITGGASGLGENLAIHFAAKGAIVYICDLAEGKGKQIEKEFKKKIRFIKCDVTNEEQVKGMLEIIEKESSRLDIVVNSAGILHTEDTANENTTHSMLMFEKVWKVNTYGAFLVSKYAAKLMIKNADINKDCNGNIILFSSVSGIEGRAGKIAYSMSKAALIGMTLPMARDLGKWKIRVNTIAPLMIVTPMNDSWKDSEVGKKLMDCIPLKRFGRTSEVSELVDFIIRCDFMNGEIIRIDGGGRLGHF